MNKPYSESCDQNREPILSVIRPLLAENSAVLEVGSGTGQHAVYFAHQLPHLVWHTSDCTENLSGIKAWLDDAMLVNTRHPFELDVSCSKWPTLRIDAVFSANTTHIMHWGNVVDMFAGIGEALPENGKFVLYGPFNYNGNYTSASNARFDEWLKSRDPESGIRDFNGLNELAKQAGLILRNDYGMPANNRLLYWQKQSV